MQPLRADRLDDEIDGAGAHGGNDVVDAAMRGLHDYGHADPRLTHSGENAETVETRHHQIEDHAIDPRAFGAAKQRKRSVAVIARRGLVAEFLQHAFQQPALHRIVVDDEDSHRFPWRFGTRQVVPFRGNVAERT